MSTLFTVLHILVCVILIAVVLLQEGKDPGMKGIAGSTPDTGDSAYCCFVNHLPYHNNGACILAEIRQLY